MKKRELEAMRWYYQINRKQGQPALAAWNGAKRTIFFRAWLAADVAAHKRRSKAAKKAWRVRKQQEAR